MILGDLSDTKRVEALHPLLGKLFSYIKEHDFLSDSIGRIELDGDRVFINNDYPILPVLNRNQVVEDTSTFTSMCMFLLMLMN